MIEKDLDKVLNYMKQYVENKYEHDSEPMLTWKDLKLVLNEIERLNNIINELKLCNTEYYNLNILYSTKLLLINKYISNSERELTIDSYYKFKDLCEFDDIKNIIFDKNIKLGSDK